ncbi:MAG: hypothetical protein IJ404_04305 [Clostridia bacterium]|nr:hypothetical protein [Clostridia bacterium]
MKELLFAVMCVSVCAAIISMLSPENESIKKQISFVCALAICASLSLPIIQLITGEHGVFDISLPKEVETDDSNALDAIISLTSDRICDEMESIAERRYGIENAVLTLTLDTSDKESIKILSGTLSGEGSLKEAADYIGKELGCEIGYEE